MRITISGRDWKIDGQPTYRGARAEGLLMNVRMVNAVFEDAGRPSIIDPDKNTERFIAAIPRYVAHGVRAFTICLQGGHCGYEGTVNTAFEPDGSLRPAYLKRVDRVITACDRAGATVILGCYYQRQDQYLRDWNAVRAGVENAARYIRLRCHTNVLLEVANEFGHGGFDHEGLRTAQGIAELIRVARESAPGVLVSASGGGDGRVAEEVAQASDFILFHLNSTPLGEIAARIADLRQYGKPMACNEDRKLDAEGAAAAQTCVENGASWGFMAREVNQYFPPFRYNGPDDDHVVYAKLKALTTPPERSTMPAGAGRAVDGRRYFPAPDTVGGWRALDSAADVRLATGMDRTRLDEAYAYIKTTMPNGGLLVARHGWLVYERYFGLASREARPELASCGKSFTSLALGILMDERVDLFPNGLDQKVYTPDYLPEVAFPLTDPAKAEIKLGQLLAFSAGIRGNNPSYVQNRPVALDPLGPDGWQAMVDECAAGRRDYFDSNGNHVTTAMLWCPPGGGYSYASASAHLCSMIVRHITGGELEDYLRAKVAAYLGWGSFGYGYRQWPDVTHKPGGGGITMRAIDVLRFAYMLLRDGCWGARQVVPAWYVRHCSQASPHNPHYPYSLQFDVNSTGQLPEAPRDAFWKAGSGGHALYIVPSLDLVAVKLGGRDGQYDPRNSGQPLPPAEHGEVGTPLTDELSRYQSIALRTTLELIVKAVRD